LTGFNVLSLKLEDLIGDRFGCWPIYGAECPRKCIVTVTVADLITDDETHNFIGGGVVLIGLNVPIILEGDVLSFELVKVDDDVIALGHCDLECLCLDGIGKEPTVGTDDMEGDSRSSAIDFEVKLELSANGSIKHAEAVFAWFNLEVWPRLPVAAGKMLEVEDSVKFWI
jgi:hypothetical protein